MRRSARLYANSIRAGLLVLAALAAAAACAFAQTSAALPDSPAPASALLTTASLHGVVTSTDGAVYEGARVTLEMSGSGAPQTAEYANRQQRRIQFCQSALRVHTN